ncbi:MAG: 50S ribosomal protein L24 [Microgenomates bacterium 39_7]|nr:MAG: 50S ribosomal protein L24 [Microgenomates bacterium 39_7]
MKFKVGDKVLVTTGKDKGLVSEITAVFPQKNQVLVKGANHYVKHVKPMPMMNRPGERIRKERPLSVAKIAIINDQGNPDRIGFKVNDQGKKIRIFKKTGKQVPDVKEASKETKKTEKSKTKAKKSSKKSKK